MRVLSAAAALIAIASVAAIAIASSGGGTSHDHHGHSASYRVAARGGSCASAPLPKLGADRAEPPADLTRSLPALARRRRRGDSPPRAAAIALRLRRARGVSIDGARRVGSRNLWLVPVRDVGGVGCARHRSRPGVLVVGSGALSPRGGGTIAQIRSGRATIVEPCFGTDGELVLVGSLLPGAVREASLLAHDGSSLQAIVTDGYAEFVLALRDAAAGRSRTLMWLDDQGARHRAALELPTVAVHCPPQPMSVGRPEAVGLRMAPFYGNGPRFSVTVPRTRRGTCLRVPGVSEQPCLAPSILSHQDGLQGYAFRLPRGAVVLDGLADASAIRAVRVRRVGWPSGMTVTLPVSRSGAFALAERGRFVHGGAWQLRVVLRSGQEGVLRSVGIGSTLAGPPAAKMAEQLVAHYAVLRRSRTAADELPAGTRGLQLGGVHQFDANPAFSRRVADDGKVRFWLVPGERSLCLIEATAGNRGGSTGCGSTDQAGYYDGHAPLGSSTYSAPRTGTGRRHFRVFVLLPDGCSDARLQRGGRTVRHLAIRTNGVLVTVAHGGRLSWRAPDGTRHSVRIA
jgi:hypothetical protein